MNHSSKEEVFELLFFPISTLTSNIQDNIQVVRISKNNNTLYLIKNTFNTRIDSHVGANDLFSSYVYGYGYVYTVQIFMKGRGISLTGCLIWVVETELES